MTLLFAQIDERVALCPPKQLLYIAVDGPAPRAKLNQQRCRRFVKVVEREVVTVVVELHSHYKSRAVGTGRLARG